MERIKWLDCYKGVLIILVCIRHILQHNVSDEGGILTNFIWAIQMPGFILVSGYFSKKALLTVKDMSRSILNKIYSYGLPFFSWYFLINILLLRENNRDLHKSFNKLIYHVDSGLWFLWVIMILGIFACIINYLITKNKSKNGLIHQYKAALATGIFLYGGMLIAGRILGLKFMGIQYILYYSIYYWLGYFIKMNQTGITAFYIKNKEIINFICVVIYIAIIYNFDLYRCTDNILSITLRIVSALTGNLILISLCFEFTENFERWKINRVGLYTLEIYAVHINVINLMENNNTIGNAFSLYSLNGFENFMIASFFMVVYTAIIIVILKFNKFTDFLMFGKVKK